MGNDSFPLLAVPLYSVYVAIAVKYSDTDYLWKSLWAGTRPVYLY